MNWDAETKGKYERKKSVKGLEECAKGGKISGEKKKSRRGKMRDQETYCVPCAGYVLVVTHRVHRRIKNKQCKVHIATRKA